MNTSDGMEVGEWFDKSPVAMAHSSFAVTMTTVVKYSGSSSTVSCICFSK